jgi:hypothetical protein
LLPQKIQGPFDDFRKDRCPDEDVVTGGFEVLRVRTGVDQGLMEPATLFHADLVIINSVGDKNRRPTGLYIRPYPVSMPCLIRAVGDRPPVPRP